MHVSAAVLTMHWLAAAGTLLLTIGSGIQAAAAISAYRAELQASGLQEAFNAILGLATGYFRVATLRDPFGLRFVRQVVELVPLYIRVLKNINRLLAIDDDKAATGRVTGAASGQVADVANGRAAGPAAGQVTASRVRQLLFTGMTWLIIMYGGLCLLGAVGLQLALDYAH